MDKKLKTALANSEGFTLVELMVVVAIIGILAAIAIPNYQKFQAKSRQTEAKIALAAVYTAEQSFEAENNSYTGCLTQAGYVPDGTGGLLTAATGTHYYVVGFSNAAATAAKCGAVGATGCDVYNYTGGTTCTSAAAAFQAAFLSEANEYAANATMVAATKVADTDLAAAPALTAVGTGADPLLAGQMGFVAGAVGVVSTNGIFAKDAWTINESKGLQNTQAGI